MEAVSIIIPSLNRPHSLTTCLESIRGQTFKDYKVYVIDDKDTLVRCRNKGAYLAKGDILVFIDDDVRCTPTWLEELVKSFGENRKIGGVSGPAVITAEYRQNRDLFRNRRLKRYIYDYFFCEGKHRLPGHIMPSGAFTTGSSDESCQYEGEVHFLEACNMAFRDFVFDAVGGFSSDYLGVGEWCEPDICFRMRKLGYKMWFNPNAKIYHEPSQQGVYKQRFKELELRYKNYLTFSKQWISPHWKHELFKKFMRTYYALKAIK